MNTLGLILLVGTIGFLVVFTDAVQTYQPAPVATTPTPVVARGTAVVPTPVLAPTISPRAPAVQADAGVLEVARQWLGVRYQWGGCTTRGVDCSCFVQNVLRTVGINAPRTTKPQSVWGTAVDRDDLQLGDLVFLDNTCANCGPNPTHVGMAIGGGQMIHCGDPCQVASISSFGSKYAGARRPPW